MGTTRRVLVVLLGLALLVGAAACGDDDSSDDSSSDTSSEESTTTTAAGGDCDVEAITAAMDNFLGQPTAAEKLTTVQDGEKITDVIQQSIDKLQGANPEVQSFGLAIDECTDGEAATFSFDVAAKADPSTGLGINQVGDAVYVDGEWLISATTVCDLTALGDPDLGQQCLTALG